WIEAYRPPQRGAVEAIVSIAQAGGGALEVGRFTVFPNVPFTAAGPQELRAYRFDASAALAKLRPGGTAVTVSVALMPNDEKISAQGSEIKLNKAELSPRP
ncbi:MAG: hypothetical protein ABI830_09420, partial [Pseudolabrys sp.]